MAMTRSRGLLAALLIVTAVPALAQSGDDEPPVERGRLETFKPGRVFFTDRTGATPREFVMTTRQSYAVEHGAGFTGEFQIVEKGAAPLAFTYEAICNSERKGYRLVRATASGKKEPDPAYSMSIVEANRSPKATEKAAYNLYWAACQKQFGKFR